MATFAYLRVSTDQQDVDSQRHGILEYANANGLTDIAFTSDSVSGKKKWHERKLGQLLESMSPGDIILFAEMSRIARSTLQVLEVMQFCIENQIEAHVVKQRMILADDLQSRIVATTLGMAAEIEREMISIRTKEALAARVKAGKVLGRPVGSGGKSKLDKHEKEIRDYMAKGINKRAIAKLLDVGHTTLYRWLDKKNIKYVEGKLIKKVGDSI